MSVVRGLPEELKMNAVSSPPSVESYSVKVVPQNISKITSNSMTIAGSDASFNVKEITVPSTQVIFDIPTTSSKNTWIDTAKSTLSFRVKYVNTAGATPWAANELQARLRSNAYSFFNRIFIQNNLGETIDDVPLTHLAHHHHLSFNQDSAEMDSVALAYGSAYEDASSNSVNTNTGHFIDAYQNGASRTSYYSYSLPLPSSLLGKFAKGMCPIGKVSKLTLTLQVDTTAPITVRIATMAASASSSTLSFEIDNISLDFQYVDLGEEGARLLGGGDMALVHGITHRVSQSTVSAGAKGGLSVLMGIRGSSVRSLAVRCQDGASTGVNAPSANGIFDSKLIHANSALFYLGGKDRVPQNGINFVSAPAQGFIRALHAAEAFNDKEMKYSSTPTEYLKYCATSDTVSSTTEYDQRIISAGSNSLPAWLANWTFAMGLQKFSKSRLLDGYDMSRNGNHFFEANLVSANTNSLQLFFIAELDIIYVFENGTVSVRV